MERPVLFECESIAGYVKRMVEWRKHDDPGFSVVKEAAGLHRCSPSLVTRVSQGKRKLTLDRVAAFAKLLGLTPEERTALEHWVRSSRRPSRKRGESHLLNDWLNVYVRDACRLKGFRPDARVLNRMLKGIAGEAKIERSLNFLFREGYLRRTLDGRIVENDPVVTTTDEIPNAKIRAFHRRALEIARRNLELYPLDKRRESALVLALNEDGLRELKGLLKEFYERLLVFAEEHLDGNEVLYQVLINLTPIGGNADDDDSDASH